MKTSNNEMIKIILPLLLLIGVGCANDNKSRTSAPPPPAQPINGINNCGVPGQAVPPGGYQYGSNSCPQAGTIYTQYGCLPVAGCPANNGMYNGQCVPAMTVCPNGVPNGFSNNGFQYPYNYQYNYQQGYNNQYYNGGYNYYNNGYSYPYNGGYNGGYYPNSYYMYYRY